MRSVCLSVTSVLLVSLSVMAGPPQYTIVNLGEVDPGDFGVQGFGVSAGGVAVGRTLGVSNVAITWNGDDGFTALPNHASRPYGEARGANDAGAIVGNGAQTFTGSSPLPLLWQDGIVSLLPLPTGESLGRANDINASGVAVGSVDGGSAEQACIYTESGGTVISTTAPDGSMMRTAFGINDAGLVVGFGIDPNNAARNVGSIYDSVLDTMSEVGALPGRNGALCFAVGNGGHVVGSSMMNQGSGTPFIWTAREGIQEVPLPAGTSQGSARGVNSDGWVVGTASNAFAIPFLYDGDSTYAVADLIPDGSGWDLSTNTSSSAMGISDDGIIIGTGVFNGDVRAYAMIPVVACDGDVTGDGEVGTLDLLALLGAWGDCVGCPADLNGDDVVDTLDLLILLGAWGPC